MTDPVRWELESALFFIWMLEELDRGRNHLRHWHRVALPSSLCIFTIRTKPVAKRGIHVTIFEGGSLRWCGWVRWSYQFQLVTGGESTYPDQVKSVHKWTRDDLIRLFKRATETPRTKRRRKER